MRHVSQMGASQTCFTSIVNLHLNKLDCACARLCSSHFTGHTIHCYATFSSHFTGHTIHCKASCNVHLSCQMLTPETRLYTCCRSYRQFPMTTKWPNMCTISNDQKVKHAHWTLWFTSFELKALQWRSSGALHCQLAQCEGWFAVAMFWIFSRQGSAYQLIYPMTYIQYIKLSSHKDLMQNAMIC